jgi:hypothetical protein
VLAAAALIVGVALLVAAVAGLAGVWWALAAAGLALVAWAVLDERARQAAARASTATAARPRAVRDEDAA